jgi:hypothetical protein
LYYVSVSKLKKWIHRAWELIGDGEKVALAQMAADFLRDKGRPMRIAIDEAVWRWNNLSKYQIASIQESKTSTSVQRALSLAFL